MKLKITAICIAALLCALPTYLSAQTKSFIKGTVSDSAKALSFATVRLYKPGNPAPLQTSLGKEDGTYQMLKPANGNYVLSFSHTGYAEQKKPISISAEGDVVVEPVTLRKAAGTLSEVVVKGTRPLVEQSDDKVILNVEDDPSAKTETAIDILRKTPFVTVDGEDNIKINGKSNFRVLLNGRETAMFASNVKEALRGFPGTTISKIEVITNPSAKYDGEGIGGLINIITKKKIVGYNGSLSTFNRTVDKVNHYSLNGNAKVGKFGLSVFMNKGYSNPITIHSNTTTIPVGPSAYNKRVLDGDQRTSGSWQFGNAELSFDIDSMHTLSLYTNLNGGSNKNSSDQTITTEFDNGAPSESHFTLYNRSKYPSTSVGTDFIKHYKSSKDREFSLRFLGSFGRNSNYLNSFQDNPTTDRYLINQSKAINNEYTLQADNSMPVKWGKFDAGAKAILRRASSDFASMVKYEPDKDYETNPSNTNNFNYRQDVVSVYSMLGFKMKKNNFRVGARVEYTNIDGDFTSSNTAVKSDYVSFLPNVQMTRKLNKTVTLVLNYNKRISRPFINDLNPFVINNDSLNISYGNPNLGPQNIHSFSTQFRFLKNGNFAGLNFEGSYSGNRIIPYSVFDAQTGVTKTTSLNIGKEYQASVNLNMNRKLSKKWTMFTNASLRYVHLSNTNDASQESDGVGVNFNLSLNYKISNRFNIASFVGLSQEARSIQTKYPFMPWHNPAVSNNGWPTSININTPEAAVESVKKLKALGVDFIKVYENIPLETYKALASEARKQRLSIAGHVPVETVSLIDASNAGHRSIEHIRDPLLLCFTEDRNELLHFFEADGWSKTDIEWGLGQFEQRAKIIKAFKKNKTWLVPTLTVEWAKVAVWDSLHVQNELRHFLPPSVQKAFVHYVAKKTALSAQDRKSDSLWWQTQKKLVNKMNLEKIPIMAGTDCACEGGMPGYSLHRELALLVEAGLTTFEALQAATIHPATFLSMDHILGSVKEGKAADLLLLDRNPITDISATQSISAVILKGELISKEKISTIKKELAIK